mmetsp:Transcript_71231/g.201877  ORF Transcript_71231/g.201877 Transcript_71231/m.201877 type:complete len:242 (+) Transcript_71231:431-1156(+)
MSCSYCRIFASTCCSSSEIFTSRLSIFSSSPSRLLSSASSRFCVVSEFCSCFSFQTSSSSMSRQCASGVVSAGRAAAMARVFEMLFSSSTIMSCLSLSFFSSSALLSLKLSMKDVISLSFVKRISYFCWSEPSSFFSWASAVTSRICARSRSLSSLSSELPFSAATMSALSFLTLLSRSSRCSGTLMLHCWTSSCRESNRSSISRLTLPSCWKRVRSMSLRSRPSSEFSLPFTWSNSSRVS